MKIGQNRHPEFLRLNLRMCKECRVYHDKRGGEACLLLLKEKNAALLDVQNALS